MGDTVQNLTSGIKQLGQSGLGLSQDQLLLVRSNIKTFRDALDAETKKIAELKNFQGSPGGYSSGEKTKQSLIDDTEAIEKLLHDYLAYLDEFNDAVNNAIGPIVDNG